MIGTATHRDPSSSSVSTRRSRVRALATGLTLALVIGALGGCSGSDGDGSSPSTTTMTVPGSIAEHEGPREPLDGFEEVTITVATDDGRTLTWCVLLAATAATQQQGLMHVTDPALGGYDGMLFRFTNDNTGGFWMKNTRLPLSIACGTPCSSGQENS